MRVQKVTANDIEFAYLEWGPRAGPLALLVHGFPDSPLTWRHLGPALADDGFRVVAPWTRGVAPSEIVPGRTYKPSELAQDLNALHDALGGRDDAILVGHDWGAIAGYRAVSAGHGLWRRMVGLAVPPEPAVSRSALSVRQLRRSWYVQAFQLPGAERLLTRGDGALVRRLWQDWSPGYEPEDDDLRPIIDAILQTEGCARALLAYYRGLVAAIALGRAYRSDSPMPYRPTLVLHGQDDGCVGADVMRGIEGIVPDMQADVLDGVGHFLHLEDPVRVNGRIRAFLAG